MDEESKYRDRFSIRELLVVLLVLGFAFGTYRYMHSLRGPVSNGLSVRQWLSLTNKFNFEIEDPKFAAEVRGFGEEAIPAFIRGFHWATNQPKEFNWFGSTKKSKTTPSGFNHFGFSRALGALVVLGREHPEKVEPVFFEMQKGARRHEGIQYLGFLGTRHFELLTNYVTSNSIDSQAALDGLGLMKSNAVAAVPAIVAEIKSARRDRRWYFSAAFALASIGENHPLTLPTLLDGLMSTNLSIHNYSSVALGRMTNQYERLRPQYLRLARQPAGLTNGFDPGARCAYALKRIGVAPDVGVPILIRRLKEGLDLERGAPRKDMSLHATRALAEYGSAASNAIPVLDRGLLRELQRLADPSNPSSARTEATLMLRRFEPFVRQMRPAATGEPNPH